MKNEMKWVALCILIAGSFCLIITGGDFAPDTEVTLNVRDTYYLIHQRVLYLLSSLLLLILVYSGRLLFYRFRNLWVNFIFLTSLFGLFAAITHLLF
ncbi:hypothetical protein [Robertkochia flava]|uniref:hypothetical protein n=1 Tax=Robertkochia flava TaxID=3447986 RepID=UPI001CCBDD5D|nr:hypothetical protein [Robertkochia marina]